jgi:hypothetical protein
VIGFRFLIHWKQNVGTANVVTITGPYQTLLLPSLHPKENQKTLQHPKKKPSKKPLQKNKQRLKKEPRKGKKAKRKNVKTVLPQGIPLCFYKGFSEIATSFLIKIPLPLKGKCLYPSP